jgi:hypothetical protein
VPPWRLCVPFHTTPRAGNSLFHRPPHNGLTGISAGGGRERTHKTAAAATESEIESSGYSWLRVPARLFITFAAVYVCCRRLGQIFLIATLAKKQYSLHSSNIIVPTKKSMLASSLKLLSGTTKISEWKYILYV